jgi:hypothetical protein
MQPKAKSLSEKNQKPVRSWQFAVRNANQNCQLQTASLKFNWHNNNNNY